ncbi:asparagine synthase (glutamine-hydrolysing) [Micromonospora pisi]|uniref:asparagine synthase (glutamine-hydrolyzing) n=1 Tax=Micromonospora pisi TaxID=589240 RepID=A0A495JRC4_9ACTN|nr:asparagine synthase (glutamine-hydrolyzing) [Micromonospora pisi]RKR91078.1 asparagine synthase (glutamine-hydrolysing) [Micromonospora pisi]
MCGLAGIAKTDGTPLTEDADDLLHRMAHAVAHRGPDEQELLRTGPVGLAFTRLSLVDPVAGSQPLWSPDEQVVLIANGEIYNHRELAAGLPGVRFKTGSDCEVLVHLYQRDGLRFLDNVRGMFAIVLWDRARDLLIFARDRFGVKPLFYHRNRERVVFGSEMKALFQDRTCPRELDWAGALADPALHGAPFFVDGPPNTWFRGIELVPAGSIVSISLRDGTSSSHQYWTFPSFTENTDMSEAEFIAAYREVFTASVRETEVSDVELGLFLSGGIDSVAVAALSTVRPRTFTAMNGSTIANGDAEYGHRAAAALGLENHQVVFATDEVPTAEQWKQLVWLLETPQCGPEIYYKRELYRYVKGTFPEIKGMLLGGGSDEFNGGYSVSMAGEGSWEDFQANLRHISLRSYGAGRPGLSAWWEQSDLSLVRGDVLLDGATAVDPYEHFFRWKYRDVQQYNCWHEDRTAAGSGIESRVPFLDHRLIELVAHVPRAMRERLTWNKRILREAMRPVVPAEFVERPKVAFFYGDGVRHTQLAFTRMLAGGGDALLEEALSGPGARMFVDIDNARATLRRLEADPGNGHVEFLLRVVNLGLLEQMAACPPSAPVDAAAAAIPVRLPVTDWAADTPRIDAEVLRRVDIDLTTVLAVADPVLLLTSPHDPQTCFVTVNGSIEYVVDAEDAPDWCRLLLAVDGTRTVASLLDEIGCGVDAVRDPLTEALELGVLTVVKEPTSNRDAASSAAAS